ncbi:PilN domain-containing protein [Geomonas ferrireducens]|uniref:PilN domain-containing protein n=1 Tax=Geomonas ferrireducens TaxID=2570227 RepID=UPI0010A8633D|nr:PilN domain-containing protein [Geomonas ferrireducens]
MRLTINLATRRYVNKRQLNAVLAVCFAVAALLLVYLVREVATNQAEINRLKGQMAAASRGPAGAPPIPAAQMGELDAKIAFANTLIDRKTVNWVGLLDKLEQVVPAGVMVTLVDPSEQTGAAEKVKETKGTQAIKVSGVALSFAHLRALLESMERTPGFSDVLLLNQGELKVDDSQRGYTFSISCKVSY